MKDRFLTMCGDLNLKRVPSIDIGDVQFVAGFASLIYGVALVSAPAAWILAGALLLSGWAIPRLQFADEREPTHQGAQR